MQDILWWYFTTLLSAGWNLGKWLDQIQQAWSDIGGWSGLLIRIGFAAMTWAVIEVFLLWWKEGRSLPSAPEDAVEQGPAEELVEEQPTLPLSLAQITIPTTPLKARVGQFPVDGVIAAAEAELSLLEEERGEK